MLRARLLLLLMTWGGCAAQGQARQGMQNGQRLDGRPMERLADASAKAVVLFFVATDCPVSNREFPEMVRLRAKFAGQGVRFWFVYPNATEKVQEIRAHQTAFARGSEGEALLDPEGRLAGLGHVMVTPEAAILVPAGAGWRMVYHGRIDDRFVHIGVERPRATEFFVERGLVQLLAGAAVTADTGTPVGCAIVPHAVAHR